MSYHLLINWGKDKPGGEEYHWSEDYETFGEALAVLVECFEINQDALYMTIVNKEHLDYQESELSRYVGFGKPVK